MRIVLSQINQDDFQLVYGVYGGVPVTLIRPTIDKRKWTDEDRHLRSLVVDDEGAILSSGLPKFHNYGEFPDRDAELESRHGQGCVTLTEKLDGSLILRDVVRGKVCWRTRGALSLGPLNEAVMGIVSKKFPTLLDPAFGPDVTLLFEYTGPEHRIVLPYSVPALAGLGHMGNRGIWDDGPPSFYPSGQEPIGGYPTPPELLSTYQEDHILQIHQKVSKWRGREGVVARYYQDGPPGRAGRYVLTKMKSRDYLIRHALLDNISLKRLAMTAYSNGLSTEEAVMRFAANVGFDGAEADVIREVWRGVVAIEEKFGEEYVEFFDHIAAYSAKGMTLPQRIKRLEVETAPRRGDALKTSPKKRWEGWFSVGIAILKNIPHEQRREAMRAHMWGMSITQLREAMKTGALVPPRLTPTQESPESGGVSGP